MINKIIKIFSVGRFEDYNSTGDVSFKKNTFIYAENGRGKTTLSAIFRSLKKNEPIFVNERSTLGNKDEPNIKLRANDENFIFKDKKWNKAKKDIEIFDSTFVNQNVFSGENVEHDHKKNLYHFIVGEKGVGIVQKVNELDLKIRDKGNDITRKEAEIQKYIIGSSISINNFLNLVDTPDIDNLISKKEKEVEVIKKSSVIASKPSPQILTLPEFPQEDLTKLLNSKLEGVLKEAEDKTRKHIKTNLDNQGEAWVQKGLSYLKGDNCPFCGQNCESIDLIEAYKGYFDEEYNKLKDNISYAIKNIQNLFSESALIHVNNNYTSNSNLFEFWGQYIEIKITELFFEEIQESWKNLRELSLTQLKEKELLPLESISVSESLNKAIEKYSAINDKIKIYNENIEYINNLIQKKKLSAGGGSLYSEEQELEKLRNTKIRYDKKITELCSEYQKLSSEKKELEDKKRGAKNELDKYTKDVFEKYQTSINSYLNKIGAGFEIAETQTSYSGGKPSSNYCIKINEVSVKLGDTKTYGQPCFRNILSQGDKNSLAFAFFLAKLDQEENIANKIIVFDDPISSLDNQRKKFTENEILAIASKAEQCIVMSHDKYFLRSVFNDCKAEETKTLFIQRNASGSCIKEWDIIKNTMGNYFEDFYKMINYLDEGVEESQFRDIARCIRPVVEGYYRMKNPRHFLKNEWLGDFIKKIDEDNKKEAKEINFNQDKFKELTEINDYSKKYHHNSNPNADTEEINDTELKSFVQRTIQLIES